MACAETDLNEKGKLMSNAELNVSEEQSRRVAEESRESTWENPSFMKELFLGNFRFDLIHPLHPFLGKRNDT